LEEKHSNFNDSELDSGVLCLPMGRGQNGENISLDTLLFIFSPFDSNDIQEPQLLIHLCQSLREGMMGVITIKGAGRLVGCD
jgi:hypothetical protein